MQLLRSVPVVGWTHMQLLCGLELVDEALRMADELLPAHGVVGHVWRIDDWASLAEDGIANERLWWQGVRPRVGSRFEQLLTPTRGPVLAATRQDRAAAEMLRAFVPAGRQYLTLSGKDCDAMLLAALRLCEEGRSDWAQLAVI